MEKPIKYKRFAEFHTEQTLETFFDELITNGWEIISYEEERRLENSILVIVICAKKQNNII